MITETAKTTIRAACPHDCPDTCAMLVTVENGRATEVRGDPEHPFTRGALCVKVNDYIERVYSPDRVLHPLRRVGPKGRGRFERITWDAALDEIAGRFRQIIAEHGAQPILPYSYLGTEGLLNGLNVGDAFFNRLGHHGALYRRRVPRGKFSPGCRKRCFAASGIRLALNYART